MRVQTLGLNHRTAPLSIRERVAFADGRLPEALAALTHIDGVREGVIVSTCNRTELHAVAHPQADNIRLDEWLCEWHGIKRGALNGHTYTLGGRDAVQHVLRVASGLDSMVLGEPQILGQMKQAFRVAGKEHSIGPLLSRLFQHAFSVAKLVRTETRIGAHPVSVAFSAVTLAHRIFADFNDQTALLIGAGETIELAARHLHEHGVGRMVVANRSIDRAQRLASVFHGYAIPLEDVPTHLADADIVVSSTASPEPLVTRAMARAAIRRRRRKPIFMLDLAVPRDIEAAVGKLQDVYLYTIDDLHEVIRQNMHSREQAASGAEEIISARTDDFMRWLQSRDAAATIKALRRQADADREDVLEKARRQLASGKPAEEVMQFLAHTLTNRLLHAPSACLRNADRERQQLLLDHARLLFDLESPPDQHPE